MKFSENWFKININRYFKGGINLKRKVVSMLIVPVILSATSVTSTFADSEKDALKYSIDNVVGENNEN